MQAFSLASFLFFLPHLDAARILVVLPLPLWSHYMQFHNLWTTLAQRGHQVTVYSAFPPEKPIENFRHVNLTMTKSREFFETFNHFELKDSQSSAPTGFPHRVDTQMLIFKFGLSITSEVFADPSFQALLRSNDKYDLVITENYFGQEALAVLGHKFRAPIIAETSYGTPHNTFLFMGNPNLYSYMPDYKFAFPSRMSFLQRLQNTALGVFTHIVGDWWYFPAQDEIMRQFSKPEDHLPYIKTMLTNISATFIYSHLMLEYQRPEVSNLVHVGGIHLKDEKLPKDLDDIMTKAPGGVIYVSFGSIIQPGKMSQQMKTDLIQGFAKLGLTVLWCWKGGAMENVPKNVIQRSWLPQQAILAHPNCRLFISHGGINSVLEAIHYAVPMIGVAFYGDQPSNVQHMVDLGAAVELSYYNLTSDSLVWAVNTVLNNRSYKFAAIKAHHRFNDRQMSPLTSAVWWVEYILRHHGAPHLRSAFDHLSWVEFLLLDVSAFVIAVLGLGIYLLLRIGKAVKSCVMYPFTRKQDGKKSKREDGGKKSKRE